MTLLFIIAIAVVGWLLYTVHLKKLLQQGKAGKIKLALVGLGLVFLVLAVTGRAPALFAIIGAAMTQVMRVAPLLFRFSPALRRFLGGAVGAGGFSGSGSAGSSTSKMSTATILMSLDHVTGSVDGDVIQGSFSGRLLSSLTINELKSLYQYCSENDGEALRLLQTYIQRQRATEWQQANPGSDHSYRNSVPASTAMGNDEACQVLGIAPPFDRKSVVAAHRSLMGQFHPDKGGSDYLATKINTARDVLLNSIKQQKS